MTSMKFVDANIFIERWSNPKALTFTNSLDREKHCTSVLVLSEVHYKLSQKKFVQTFEYIRNIMGGITVFDFTQDDLFYAMRNTSDIPINDRIHIAIMKRNDIDTIISYDKDFDREKTIKREEL